MRINVVLSYVIVVCIGCSADAVPRARFDGEAPRRVIESSSNCPQCEIVLREVARLGHPSDPTSIAESAVTEACALGRLSTEQYVVSGVTGGGQILVYDEGGRAIHVIGREGRGPGEFGSDLKVVVGPGDTLYVLDNSNLRMSSVTTAGEFLHSFRTPGRVQGQALVSGEGFLLHTRPVGTPDEDGPLFHLLSRSGTEVARFGDPSDTLADLDQWVVSPAKSGGFWATNLWAYELYRWSGPDSLLWTLVREGTPWFPRNQDLSAQRFDGMYESVPPPSSMWHIHEAAAGQLWVYALVPDEDWDPGPIRTPAPDWTRDKLDTMIEVIDLNGEPSVITRRRYDRVLSPVCGRNLMFTVVYAETGDTRAVVLQPTLVGSAPVRE